MPDRIPISEAARILKLSPARVRVLASRGDLPAAKIAGRWVVEAGAVEQRRREQPPEGRRFTAQNAWAAMLLASGENPQLDPVVRSRLKKALLLEGLQRLAPRLRDRAEVDLYRSHPGEIPYIFEDEALMRSGISAAGSVGSELLAGREADGYVPKSELQGFLNRHALSPVAGDANGNVRLRVVPDDAWSNLDFDRRPIAPKAAVALDLAGERDPRSRAAGKKLLREIDRENQRNLKKRR
ncbi:MAG TPA: helix-turn-helix domain-containing protein [Solirubrobacterales bacterium]